MSYGYEIPYWYQLSGLIQTQKDTQHLGYYWAECSGYDREVAFGMSSAEFLMRFTKLTDWVYIDDELKTIFSHAGISKVWLEKILKESDVHNINDYGLREEFGFTPDNPFDCYGDSETQPLTWIRPGTLCSCNVKGYDQVIGHTTTSKIVNMKAATLGNQNIWLCDSLGYKNYLVIEDGNFIPKVLQA